MNAEPQGKLSTADVVAAGPAARERDHADPAAAPQRDHAKPAAAPPSDGKRPERPEPRDADRHDGSAGTAALLPGEEASDLRRRWEALQTGFVDEPRRAVQEADNLVAQTMKRVAEVFARERAALEEQWTRGDNVSTEDLRVALKRYRSFFDRLLSV
jgi:hypothetical protein